MYVTRIRIDNIRSFRSGPRSLLLQRPDGSFAGWTVIAGRNGSGKSTFLKAIALSIVGPSASRSLQDSFAQWLRKGEQSGFVATRLRYAQQDRFQEGGRITGSDFWTGLKWEADPDGPEPSMKPFLGYNKTGKKAPQRGPWADNPQGWLVAGYGPFRRLSGEASPAQRLMSGPRRLASLVTLFREDASLIENVEWLKTVYMKAFERKPGAKEFESNILRLLNDGLLPDGVRAERIDSEGLWVQQGTVRLPMDELSDGYRTAAALVLDLVRQIAACSGSLRLDEDTDGHCVVRYPGVVLIDEIDVHLHVSWQQRIGFWLKSRFPKIQFIVSTHSPFICQAADPRGIIRMPAPGESKPPQHVSDEEFKKITHGGVDDAVLTTLFGLEHSWSAQTEQLREELSNLRAKDLQDRATKAEKNQIAALQEVLPLTPTGSVVRALNDVKALLGRDDEKTKH